MYTIGECIKKLREQRGMTQQQLANELFITTAMLGGIENGYKQPPLLVALAIAKYFGVTVEQLVEGEV